jgi:hypothetical protein
MTWYGIQPAMSPQVHCKSEGQHLFSLLVFTGCSSGCNCRLGWASRLFVVSFIDSFMDDVTCVKDVEVCMYSMICYIPVCICYGSENFGLGSLHDDYVGLAGATPQFCCVATYRFDYRFVH